MDAFAAGGAGSGFTPRPMQVGHHQRVDAAAHHIPGACALDLFAGTHATRAQDAAIRIVVEPGVRGVAGERRMAVGVTGVADA